MHIGIPRQQSVELPADHGGSVPVCDHGTGRELPAQGRGATVLTAESDEKMKISLYGDPTFVLFYSYGDIAQLGERRVRNA